MQRSRRGKLEYKFWVVRDESGGGQKVSVNRRDKKIKRSTW